MRKVAYYALGLVLVALPILVLLPTVIAIANSSLVFAHQVIAVMPLALALVAYYEWMFGADV